MTKPVKRHPHKLSDELLTWQTSRVEKSLGELALHDSWSSDVLEIAVRNGLTLAALVSLQDTTNVRILEALRLSGQASACLFSALGASAAVRLTIGETTRAAGPFSPDGNTDPLTWRRGFFAAACAGDTASFDRLATANLDDVRAAGGADEFSYAEITALAAFGRHDDSTSRRFVEALDAADPDKVNPAQRNFVLDVVAYELELFFRIIEGDAAGFNATLAKSLVGHKHYYSKGDPARTPIGQLALGPLAAACIANDRGIEVTVESDYIPRAVIEYPRTPG